MPTLLPPAKPTFLGCASSVTALELLASKAISRSDSSPEALSTVRRVSQAELECASDAVRFETTLWAAVPPSRLDSEESLQSAASAMDATLEAMTPDRTDVESVAARLDRATVVSDVAGEGERWQEAGYWLTPLIALFALAWFRRGWVVGS